MDTEMKKLNIETAAWRRMKSITTKGKACVQIPTGGLIKDFTMQRLVEYGIEK